MNLWVECLSVVAAVTGTVTFMFFGRQRAPAGGLFTDTDRAAGVFGVLGTRAS